MKNFLACLFLAISQISYANPTLRVAVVRVSDGDTFTATVADSSEKIKVRVLGIDCPESSRNQKCLREERQGLGSCDKQIILGKKVKKEAARLLEAAFVTLESSQKEGFKKDPFGRTLAYVRMGDDKDFGLEMLRNKMCRDYSAKYPHPRMNDYVAVLERN